MHYSLTDVIHSILSSHCNEPKVTAKCAIPRAWVYDFQVTRLGRQRPVKTVIRDGCSKVFKFHTTYLYSLLSSLTFKSMMSLKLCWSLSGVGKTVSGGEALVIQRGPVATTGYLLLCPPLAACYWWPLQATSYWWLPLVSQWTGDAPPHPVSLCVCVSLSVNNIHCICVCFLLGCLPLGWQPLYVPLTKSVKRVQYEAFFLMSGEWWASGQ